MKTLTLIFLMTINFSIYAQKSIFVRVYNSSGTIISKGHVLIITDSSLQLSGEKSNIIPVSSIGYIKTKHSESRNLIIGSILGAAAGALIGGGILSDDGFKFSFSGIFSGSTNNTISNDGGGSGTKAILGGFVGIPIGAAIGDLTNSFKKSKTYLINGDLAKWKAFQLMVSSNNVK